jgi:CRP-like cAMP-binding protein
MNFRNFLLSSLADNDLRAIMPSLTEVSLRQGQVLFEVGATADYIYFPSSAVLSVVTVMEDGRSVETATIGRESGAALLNVIANIPAESRTFAQIGGSAVRLPAKALRNQLAASPALNGLLMQHIHATFVQAQQFVACNVLHSAEQRLARWLLMTADRTGGLSFPLTQEYMAVMTGVQRTTVSALASAFKEEGLIRYSRGNVEILDAPGLEKTSCECLAIAHQHFSVLRGEAAE